MAATPKPTAEGGCSYDDCPEFDGKRCSVIGCQPGRGCSPSWAQMHEACGHAVDRLENLLAAMKLPLPPRLHLEGLSGNLESIRDELRAALPAEEADHAA